MTMDMEGDHIYRWVREKRDPTAEMVAEILSVLKALNSEEIKTFAYPTMGKQAEFGVLGFASLYPTYWLG